MAEEAEILMQVFNQTSVLLVKALLSKDPAKLIQEWGKKKLV
jgi:PTH1 family peptidyl-tRNA hydrolase